ncbi:MAG TPA: hypothetical protein VKM55_01645 [Candidatus Lokiarchaeia archaeon]|nr:hypothetical protein [Candidatus Lokiarchaeia archaeon]
MTEYINDYASGSSIPTTDDSNKIETIRTDYYTGNNFDLYSKINHFLRKFSAILNSSVSSSGHQPKNMSAGQGGGLSSISEYDPSHDIEELLINLRAEFSLDHDLLPELFDSLIDFILDFCQKNNVFPPISFKMLYLYILSINLQGIPEKTINKIGSALQWRKLPVKWVNLDFWIEYYLFVSTSSTKSYKNAIKILIQIIRTAQIEELKQLEFENEVRKIIMED